MIDLEKLAISSELVGKSLANRLFRIGKGKKEILDIAKNVAEKNRISPKIDLSMSSLKKSFLKVPGFSEDFAHGSAIESRKILSKSISDINRVTKSKKINISKLKSLLEKGQ